MAKNYIGVGIDLGTNNLLVYIEGNGIIFNEPSVVAFDRETGNVIAIGHDAYKMIGKTHDKITVSKPLANGVISDLDAAKALLRAVFERIQNFRDFSSVRCVICCPSELTQIERNAMRDLGLEMGIPDVFIEEEIKAGAIGSGIDIFAPKATLIVDIGGGTTDVGVLSLGDVVVSQSIKVAGNYIDNTIIRYAHRKYNLIIGERMAENAKIAIATLEDHDEPRYYRLAGRDLVTGLPASAEISSTELRELLLPIFDEIVALIYSVLAKTPPELAADIVTNGIIIEGGGALIPGVREFFEEMVRVPVTISPNPLTSVVEGSKTLLKNRGSYLINPLE